MEISQLSKIGLTPGEIKVYLALVKYGSQSKSPLSNKADISSSKVYEIAGKLIKKGLISSFLKNNVTYYNASDPIFLEKYIEEKEKELQAEKEIVSKLIPKLKKLKESSEEKISFELQEGWKGTQNAITEGLEHAPKNSTVYGIGIQFPRTEFINRFHKKRLKKNIKLKIILAESVDKKQNYKNAEIRFMEEISEVGMGIYPDRVLIQALDNPPLNLVLKHPRIVKSFKKIYESLWKSAKK